MQKKIAINITEFALPVPRVGSIDHYSGMRNGQELGIELHQRLQKERAAAFNNYQAEAPITHCFSHDNYIFEISGRMDGIHSADPTKIEEIKSAFNVYELYRHIKGSSENHPYCLQLKTYGYLHWLKTKEIPDLSLLLVSLRNEEIITLTLKLDIQTYEEWFFLRLKELAQEVKSAQKRIQRRKKAGAQLGFPFNKPRSGQLELIATIENGIQESRPMLIQAPTGLGKTIGVTYPLFKNALQQGQKVIYVTPKNSQHAVAENAIELIQQQGTAVKSLTLTAKQKMCFKNEPICNPDYCEFAKDHYTKVAQHQLAEKLSKKKKLTVESFKEMGAQFEVCPYELQFAAIQYIDLIICDYNYVFANRGQPNRISLTPLGEEGKPNLIIDEVHNLPTRAMDYYSPSLTSIAFEKMLTELDSLPPNFKDKMELLLTECNGIVNKAGPANTSKACQIDPPVRAFTRHDEKLREFLSSYLNSDVTIEQNDVVMRLTYYWGEFTAALEFITTRRNEFFTTFHPFPATVKITCCDASEMLQPSYSDYQHIVGFSATLKPFAYYSQLSGLMKKNVLTTEFASPFPVENRKILVIPQVSSKYSDRERNYPRIAEAIQKIIAIKKGNYFAFFPSFDFLERVLQFFIPPEDFIVLQQNKRMNKEEINHILLQLQNGLPHIVFGVQGGVFSEGVDYPGDMIIGVFIVGAPLPNYDLEREKMREYYQQKYQKGFEYAYTYPAMSKAVQAAGRVIRSETDKGIIVLMDNRFIHQQYANCFPADWYHEHAHELVSQSILHDLQLFWGGKLANNN